jgi:hypothetical protein
VVSVAILTTAVLLFVNIGDGPPGLEVMNPIPGTVISLATIAICVAIVIYQYRRRRRKRSVTLAACGLLVVVIGPVFWPWRSMPPSRDPGAWAHDEVRTVAIVEPDPPHVGDEPAFQRRDRATKQISAHIRLSGVPDEFAVQRAIARSRFEVAGTTLVSTSRHGFSPVGGCRRSFGLGHPAAAVRAGRRPDLGPRRRAVRDVARGTED